jgi:protein O-GlcNAc transferase
MAKESRMRQGTTDQAMQLAIQHHQAGRLADAEKIYRQVLSQQPGNPGALHLLGVIALQAGRLDAAIELIRQAIAIKPADAGFHNDLGNALRGKGLLDEAVAAYRQVLRLRPGNAQAHSNLGNALYDKGLLDEAIAAYRQALQIGPGLTQTQGNLGNALRDRGLLDEAIAAYREALRLKPDQADTHNNLGNALRDQGLLDEAIAAYRQSLKLKPDYAVAHNNLGIAQRDQGLLDEAIADYRQAVQLKPDYADAHNNLGVALRDQGLLDEAIAACRQAVALNPNSAPFHSNLVLITHYHEGSDPRVLLAESRQWARQHADPLKRLIPTHANDRSPARRLKIGYVSPDFRDHPVGRFLLPLLAAHEPAQVEIFCYAQIAHADAITQRIRGYAHQWRNTVGLTTEQLAEQIRQDRIDVLIDLAAHTGCNRLLVFARKPAPVQATYLAYAGTTGLETIDYRITDPHLDPPGSRDEHYSEKSIRIESYWCYQPPIETLEPTPLPAARSGFVTFGCLNNFCKITPATLQTWRELLAAVPNSRLRLHASPGSHRDRICRFLRDSGIDSERLTFVARLSLAAYMEEYQRIDIGLDPFPYVGGTTTCDALWMGVPVITLCGQTAVSRGGVSILNNVGLPELIADNTGQYVRIAAGLAADLPRLDRLRSGLREKMRLSTLMNAPRFARNIEAAYRRMWQNWCASRS